MNDTQENEKNFKKKIIETSQTNNQLKDQIRKDEEKFIKFKA